MGLTQIMKTMTFRYCLNTTFGDTKKLSNLIRILKHQSGFENMVYTGC